MSSLIKEMCGKDEQHGPEYLDDSNIRLLDYETSALPTELRYNYVYKMNTYL